MQKCPESFRRRGVLTPGCSTVGGLGRKFVCDYVVHNLEFRGFGVLRCGYIETPGLGLVVEFSWRFEKL